MLADSEIVHFFENREVCLRAAHSLSDSAKVGLEIYDSSSQMRRFRFQKSAKQNRLVRLDLESEVQDNLIDDFIFVVPELTLREIVQSSGDDIGEKGIFILKKMMGLTPSTHRIQVQIKIGLLGMTRKGYLGVLARGGGAVANFLATHGFSLTSIRSWKDRFS